MGLGKAERRLSPRPPDPLDFERMTQATDNQALEDAMRAVANGDAPENRIRLYAAMARTSFLVPLEAAGALPAEEVPRARLGRPIAGPESPELTIVVCEAGDQHGAGAFTHLQPRTDATPNRPLPLRHAL